MVMPSGSLMCPGGLSGNRLVRPELRVVPIEGRAIGANRLGLGAHVDEDMRVIERREGADAHEFTRTDFDDRKTHLVLEMRCRARCHANLEMLVSRAD
jgi:hypothetical protein